MLLLPTATKTVAPGERTGITVEIQSGQVIAGTVIEIPWMGAKFFCGDANVDPGMYEIVGEGGTGAVAKFHNQNCWPGPDTPGQTYTCNLGQLALGIFSSPPGVDLMTGHWDIVPQVVAEKAPSGNNKRAAK